MLLKLAHNLATHNHTGKSGECVSLKLKCKAAAVTVGKVYVGCAVFA